MLDQLHEMDQQLDPAHAVENTKIWLQNAMGDDVCATFDRQTFVMANESIQLMPANTVKAYRPKQQLWHVSRACMTHVRIQAS